MQKQPFRVFLGKGVLKICSKFTREHPGRSVISIKLLNSLMTEAVMKELSNFIEITLRHGCSSVNLLHIFRKPYSSGWLLLNIDVQKQI